VILLVDAAVLIDLFTPQVRRYERRQGPSTRSFSAPRTVLSDPASLTAGTATGSMSEVG
jgi:hypothetical protein